MHYYTFQLDEESSDLCTIITLFGKFCYLQLPMGIKQSPNISQEIMESILNDLQDEGVEVFLDNISIFSNNYEDHMLK